MSHLWYRCWHWLCTRIYYDRIRVLGADRLPQQGPALYVGLHRNGAVDGFVYAQVLPRTTFLISQQLVRNAFARLFFHGIAVARPKDAADRSNNRFALDRCVRLLVGGGELFVFPEGTSSLGPRHLPFKSGAAQIALKALDYGRRDLRIIPLGIHYDCAWEFRSRVEVVVGPPLQLTFDPTSSPQARVRLLKRRIREGLEEVGINVASSEEQRRIEHLASTATLGTSRSYFRTLKTLESRIPEPTPTNREATTTNLEDTRLLGYQGVPVFPSGPTAIQASLLLLLAPIVVVGAGLNAPPLLIGAWAGRRFADDRNVVALWRILLGLPCWVVWCLTVSLVLLIEGQGMGIGLYAAFTMGALALYRRFRLLAVAVHNALLCRASSDPGNLFRNCGLQELPPES